MQAASNAEGNVANVRALTQHPAFSITNPNCCYSLILAFARSAVNFHAADGSGYQFIADMILELDKVRACVLVTFAAVCAGLQKDLITQIWLVAAAGRFACSCAKLQGQPGTVAGWPCIATSAY